MTETGAEPKDIVIFDYNQDRGIASAYNFKSRKLQMVIDFDWYLDVFSIDISLEVSHSEPKIFPSLTKSKKMKTIG